MVDVYNKQDKASEVQAKRARIAHLGDYIKHLDFERKSAVLEMERLSQEVTFGEQSEGE